MYGFLMQRIKTKHSPFDRYNAHKPSMDGSTPDTIKAAFLKAVETNRVDVLIILLKKEVWDIDVRMNNDEAIIKAASKGHVLVIRMLIAAGANVHARRDKALKLAAQNGHMRAVRILLDTCVDDRTPIARMIAAMNLATRNGHDGIASLLLKLSQPSQPNGSGAPRIGRLARKKLLSKPKKFSG
jgi:ankyrin repeat protein